MDCTSTFALSMRSFKTRQYATKWKNLLHLEDTFQQRQIQHRLKTLSKKQLQKQGFTVLDLHLQLTDSFFGDRIARLSLPKYAPLPTNQFALGTVCYCSTGSFSIQDILKQLSGNSHSHSPSPSAFSVSIVEEFIRNQSFSKRQNKLKSRHATTSKQAKAIYEKNLESRNNLILQGTVLNKSSRYIDLVIPRRFIELYYDFLEESTARKTQKTVRFFSVHFCVRTRQTMQKNKSTDRWQRSHSIQKICKYPTIPTYVAIRFMH